MAIPNLYSFRNRESNSEYQYDNIDSKLRHQIILTWEKFYNQFINDDVKSYRAIWYTIESEVSIVIGKLNLNEYLKNLPFNADRASVYFNSYKVKECFLKITDLNDTLSIIESIFSKIPRVESFWNKNRATPLRYNAKEAIMDLNAFIGYSNLGYEFVNEQIIRKDNKLLHTEIVNPVLHLLSNIQLKNAEDEFLSALGHFKNAKNKECVNDCLKSLETTLKIICHHNGWTYDAKDTAKKLINICFDNNLIPSYLESHFSALRTTIEDCIPTVRNKTSGHGQGVNKITVPEHFASYIVYMTGTTIKFLIDCQNQIKPF